MTGSSRRRKAAFPAVSRVLAAGFALAALADGAHRWASTRAYGRGPLPTAREAILVLGCPSRDDGSLHPLQRWRCEIAARTLNPSVGRVVFTGTTAKTDGSEAAVMAAHARCLGVPGGLIVLEEEAQSTWQNLEFSAPLIEEFQVLRIVSDPLHAWRARTYLARQRPDLAARLAPAVDHRWGERLLLKAGTLAYETVVHYREWRTPRLPR